MDTKSVVQEQIGDVKGLRSKLFSIILKWVTRNNKEVNRKVIEELDRERARQANAMTDNIMAKMAE